MGQGPVFNFANSTTRGVSPYAGNEAGNCYNGVTYLQKLSNGHGQLWAYTSDTVTHNSMNPACQIPDTGTISRAVLVPRTADVL